MNLYIKLSVCVPRLIPGRGFYAQISLEITCEFPGVTGRFTTLDFGNTLITWTLWNCWIIVELDSHLPSIQNPQNGFRLGSGCMVLIVAPRPYKDRFAGNPGRIPRTCHKPAWARLGL